MRRRSIPPNTRRPEPKSSIDAGSGVGDGVGIKEPSPSVLLQCPSFRSPIGSQFPRSNERTKVLDLPSSDPEAEEIVTSATRLSLKDLSLLVCVKGTKVTIPVRLPLGPLVLFRVSVRGAPENS